VACIAGGLLFAHSAARAASAGDLQQQIGAGQDQIQNLIGALSSSSSHLAQLNASIAALERQIASIQAQLDARRAELHRTRVQLRAARIRLKQLQAFQMRAEHVLAAQLVSTYERDNPDLVTVVLESDGFQSLLERVAFAARIRRQNVQIIREVRAARRAVAAEAIHLGALEVRQQQLTAEVLQQRNQLTGAKVSLVHRQIAVARERAAESNQLANARAHVASLEHRLSQLQAAQSAQASSASAAGASGGGSAAPSAGSGGFVFPLPKGAASPPGSWSLDQGVDISAPGDTPEYAVCAGTIVLHGIGGFGPSAPVLHCDSSIDGYSYVYYGHAGPADQLPVGTHVSAGEVMSSVGPGIVGISTGPHLEIGFADSSGSPIGAGSAGAMMSLLQSAY
jgi:murein DD-endopeptidase MepM/ murein hydrolase activator NlpD